MKIHYVVWLVALLILVAGCTRTRSIDRAGLTYEQLCKNNGDQWMEMEPWEDGKKIGTEKCVGCMIADNHFCIVEEYINYIDGIQGSMMEIQDQKISAMDHDRTMPSGMTHQAMTAAAGNENSVSIHNSIVGFAHSSLNVGEEATLAFLIKNKETNQPLSNLEIVHDKIMHVVLVRDDLQYFDHIHPLEVEPGRFDALYTFASPGKYRLWIDFTVDGMQHIVSFDTVISGEREITPKDSLGKLKVEMNTPEIILKDKPIKLQFAVNDKNDNSVPITEKFLAATAHLITIDQTRDEFAHFHDEEFDQNNILSFETTFQKAGKHSLWVQFSVDGITRTEKFEIEVNE